MTGEQLGHLVRAGDEVEHARREVRRLEGLGEDVGAQAGLRGGLEHDGAAGRQRRGQLRERERQRVAPRGDHRRDADRFLPDDGVAAEVDGNADLLRRQRAGQGGVIAQDGDRDLRVVEPGGGDRHAHLGGHQAGGVPGPVLQRRGQPVHGRGPLGPVGARPRTGVEGLPGRAHRDVDIGPGHRGGGAHDLLGGRVGYRDRVR